LADFSLEDPDRFVPLSGSPDIDEQSEKVIHFRKMCVNGQNHSHAAAG